MYLGIDNGLDGGLALLSQTGELLEREAMPVEKLGKGRQVVFKDVQSLVLEWMQRHDIPRIIVILEKPNNAQTCSTAASMASSFARCECALIQLRVRYELITPQKWQNSKLFWTKPKMAKGQKFDTKAAAKVAAKKLWPKEEWLKTPRCSTPHDGMIDAALIAEYARRNQF